MKSLRTNLWECRWAFVPPALLLATVSSAAIAVSLALRDAGGGASEPDSYRRGMLWDAWKEQQAQNGVLRWGLTPEVVPLPGGAGAHVQVAVADKHAVPLEGAQVEVEVIPIRCADARVHAMLLEGAAGRYGASIALRDGGLWELRMKVEWNGHTYVDRVRRSVLMAQAQSEVPP